MMRQPAGRPYFYLLDIITAPDGSVNTFTDIN